MSLHHSKRTAILQWFNSFSASDLSKISDLADGKHFCDTISSVFGRKPSIDVSDLNSSDTCKAESEAVLPDTKNSDELINDSNIETAWSSESVSFDSDNKDFGANRNDVEKPVEIKISVPTGVDLDANSETEPYPFDVDTTDSSVSAKIKKDIQNEISKVLGTESDIFSVEENKEKEVGAGEKENSLVVAPSPVKKRGRPRHSTKSTSQLKVVGGSEAPETDTVEQRFNFVKLFVDEMFCINTGTLVDYFLCKQSNELELGKVGVLVLSLVVKQYLKENMTEKLDTLTLLDIRVQEDIQECLSMVLQDRLTQKELHRLLTSHAKYKISPRKSPRLCTPVRSNSSKLSSSVLTMALSHEDIFCDSPLKSFLDSPQLKKALISKDQELIKTRRVLHAEEVRSEELELEVNHLKKKLVAKDNEMQKLKAEIRELQSKEAEQKECDECSDFKDKLKLQENLIKDLRAEAVEKDKQYEEEQSKLTSQITMLQGKVQLLKRMQNESSAQTPESIAEVVKTKEEEISALKSSNRRLKVQLEEMLRNYSFVHSQLNSSRNHDDKDESGLNHLPSGECIGSVIEEENKGLRKKLLKAAATLENMLNKWKIKESIAEDFRMHFSFLTCSDSKLLDASQQSDLSSVYDLDATTLSKSGSFSNLSSVSLATPTEMKLRRQPSRKRKLSCSSMRSDSSVALGSLWAQYQDHTPYVHVTHTIDEAKLDLLKQLGFSKADYPSKMEVIQRSLLSLKDLFYQNGSNGLKNFPSASDLDQTLKSEEECLKCLICIRDSLSSFNSRTAVPEVKCEDKESRAADSTECCDDKVDIMDQLQKANEELQKANEELQINLSKTIAMSSAELDEKINEIRGLSSQLEAVELQNKELSASKELLQDQNIELRKKLDSLKSLVSKMTSKVSENDKMKSLYVSLINEKNENEQKYKKQLRLCREKFLSFEMQKKEFAAIREKEKANMREMATQIELFKNELIAMRVQKRNLEKHIKDLKSKNDQLAVLNGALEEEIKQQKDLYEKVAKHAAKQSLAHVSHSQNIENNLSVYAFNKENYKEQVCNNLNVAERSEVFQLSDISNSAVPGGKAIGIPEIVLPDSCLENSMSTSVFNKSVHHGSLMLFTDDEEGFLNHSSIAEIKKDYDPVRKEKRLRELYRRNSMYLPHMRSSYPVEFQAASPFTSKVLEQIQHTPQAKSEEELGSQFSGEHLVKKRRISEHPSTSEAGTSSAVPVTPVTKTWKTFKTPASLKKLLNYRRKTQRRESFKSNY